MSRFLAGFALVVVLVLVLGPPAALPVHAGGAAPFCYNVDFVNNIAEDAMGLLAQFGGIQHIDEVYSGDWNPFGAPTSASGYDPKTDTYTLVFAGGLAYAGDTVHAGLCTDSPSLQRPATGNVPPLVWQRLAERAARPAFRRGPLDMERAQYRTGRTSQPGTDRCYPHGGQPARSR